MGHFSVSCSLTKSHITEGDDCALVLTFNNKRRDNKVHLPIVIRGTYSGYGYIEDVEKTSSTQALEKLFGCEIEELCDYITSSTDRRPYPYSSNLFSGRVSQQIKDLIAKPWNYELTDDDFNSLGFTKISERVYKYNEKEIEVRNTQSDLNPIYGFFDRLFQKHNICLGFDNETKKRIFLLKSFEYFWVKGTAWDEFLLKDIDTSYRFKKIQWWGDDIEYKLEDVFLFLGFKNVESLVREKWKKYLVHPQYECSIGMEKDTWHYSIYKGDEEVGKIDWNYSGDLLKLLAKLHEFTGVHFLDGEQLAGEHGLSFSEKVFEVELEKIRSLSGTKYFRWYNDELYRYLCENSYYGYDILKKLFGEQLENISVSEMAQISRIRKIRYAFGLEKYIPQDGNFNALTALGKYLIKDSKEHLKRYK